MAKEKDWQSLHSPHDPYHTGEFIGTPMERGKLTGQPKPQQTESEVAMAARLQPVNDNSV